jgi:hypothetical protein
VEYCSAHLGVPVPTGDRYLLVNAWYTGGVDVIDKRVRVDHLNPQTQEFLVERDDDDRDDKFKDERDDREHENED